MEEKFNKNLQKTQTFKDLIGPEEKYKTIPEFFEKLDETIERLPDIEEDLVIKMENGTQEMKKSVEKDIQEVKADFVGQLEEEILKSS